MKFEIILIKFNFKRNYEYPENYDVKNVICMLYYHIKMRNMRSAARLLKINIDFPSSVNFFKYETDIWILDM